MKFLSWLISGKLHFSKLANLCDAYEGGNTDINVALNHHSLRMRLEKNENRMRVPPAQKLEMQFYEHMRDSHFVNCWYENEFESEAMWKLYGNTDGAVAVKTTVQKLTEAITPIDDRQTAYIGKVQYIDYRRDFFPQNNAFYRVMHKRKSFMHEQEIRLVASSISAEKKDFLEFNAPLEKAASCIIFSPQMPVWQKEIVAELIEKHDSSVHFQDSEIDIGYKYG